MERWHSVEAKRTQFTQALRQWPVSPRRSSAPRRVLPPARQRFVPEGTPDSAAGELTCRLTVLLCEWIKLITSATAAAAAVLRSAPLRAKWNMESFADAISSGLDCYWSHKMGGKENGEHLHVNQTYACRCVESILFSIAFIDFSWVVFPFSFNVLCYTKCAAPLFPNNNMCLKLVAQTPTRPGLTPLFRVCVCVRKGKLRQGSFICIAHFIHEVNQMKSTALKCI